MSTKGFAVPRLRAGVVVKPGARTEIRDPAKGKSYLLDAALYPVLSRIDGRRSVDQLIEAAKKKGHAPPPPDVVEQAITALDRLALLEPRGLADRPLRFQGGRGFQCVACGESCRRFRVGPIKPEDRAHIEGVDWRARGYADVPEVPFVEAPDGPYLKKRADGYCVFFGADGLCNVHRELGAEKKPLVCRLFPFEPLEDEDGVRILFRLECASLPAALVTGGPSPGDTALVREYLARRESSPTGFPATPFYARSRLVPLPLAPGAGISEAAHAAIRERSLAALEDAARGPALERFAAIVRGLRAVVEASTSAGEDACVAAFERGLASPAPGVAPDRSAAHALVVALRVGLTSAGVLAATGASAAGASGPGAPAPGAPAPPRGPETQRTLEDLPVEAAHSRVRVADLLDSLARRLESDAPAPEGAPAALPPFHPRAPRLPNPGAPKDFGVDDAWAFYLGYELFRERPFFKMGDLVYGTGALALRFALARAHAGRLACARGKRAPDADDALDAVFDVEAVVRIVHTEELAPALARFLETEAFRLLG